MVDDAAAPTNDHQNQADAVQNSVPASAPPASEDTTTTSEINDKLKVKDSDMNALLTNTPSPCVPDSHLKAPSYQKVERQSNDPLATDQPEHEHFKTCRICLEDDDPDSMIAPCKCRGSSKWVHRDCLDEWRLNERDRAFSQCTECLFEYYMQPIYTENEGGKRRWRKMRFCWNVSRDVCFGTLVLQLVILALGAIIFACDSNQALPNQIFPVFANHPWSLYYLLGWLSLLVVVGCYGSVVLCLNGCSISKSIPQVQPPVSGSQNGTNSTSHTSGCRVTSGATNEDRFARDMGMESNSEFYRRARHRRQQRVRSSQHHGSRYHDHSSFCDSCVYCCNRQPVIIYDPGYHPCCCCGHNHAYSPNAGSEDCNCDCCGNSAGGNGGNQECGEAIHILLLILLAVAVILAVTGFFVGIVVAVIAFQRVVQRHIHLIQKRQLVQDYQVMDLQEYNLNQPLPTAPQAKDLEWNVAASSGTIPSPAAPLEPLPEKDICFLRRMGLME
jgi:hypothetical protein